MPPIHTSSGFWIGFGITPMPSRWKSGPSWSTASSVHSRRISGSASSNHAAPRAALDPERLLLVGVGDSEAERGKQAAA